MQYFTRILFVVHVENMRDVRLIRMVSYLIRKYAYTMEIHTMEK